MKGTIRWFPGRRRAQRTKILTAEVKDSLVRNHVVLLHMHVYILKCQRTNKDDQSSYYLTSGLLAGFALDFLVFASVPLVKPESLA